MVLLLRLASCVFFYILYFNSYPPSCRIQDQQQQRDQQDQRHAGRLPLLSLQLSGCLEGTLIRSVTAACQGLTQLQLQFNSGLPAMHIPCAEFLELRRLQELRIAFPDWTIQDCHNLAVIKSLTQLTKLELPNSEPFDGSCFPPSLQHLCIKGPNNFRRSLDLTHLTNLQHLQVDSTRKPQLLPTCLKSLTANDFAWQDSFMQLQELRDLHVSIGDNDVSAAVLWGLDLATQLTGLHVVLKGPIEHLDSDPGLQEMLPKLPLVELTCNDCYLRHPAVAMLGSYTQLTSLCIHRSYCKVTPAAFGEVLRKLLRLEHLSCSHVQLQPHPYLVREWRPVTEALVSLPNLQRVSIRDWELSSEQLGELRVLPRLQLDYTPGVIGFESLWESESEQLNMGEYLDWVLQSDDGSWGSDGSL